LTLPLLPKTKARAVIKRDRGPLRTQSSASKNDLNNSFQSQNHELFHDIILNKQNYQAIRLIDNPKIY
jgi:hypothetical protein